LRYLQETVQQSTDEEVRVNGDSGDRVWRTGLPRRDFLRVGGATLLVTASVGCDVLSTEPAQERQDGSGRGASGRKGKEAPQLAEMVENGELPPVEERLPENPLVVEPVERMGIYGGTWNRADPDPASWAFSSVSGMENLMWWDRRGREVIPNVAESFEINEEGTEYTFRLRKGMKWSDGEPFTADDIIFWYEDIVRNEELSPEGLPRILTLAQRGVETVEKVDDYAVRFVFPVPNGLFLQRLASPYGAEITNAPRHYLERFHKKYNPDVEALVEEEGADDWIALFGSKASDNPELPTLAPWRIVTLGEGGRSTAERNPYYWKVDPEGSQLPRTYAGKEPGTVGA
jgi:ABC-type transport system substrate-binding protein